MKQKASKIFVVILQMALIAIIIWGLHQIVTSVVIGMHPQPDVEYQMANQHIVWTGAGYDGGGI